MARQKERAAERSSRFPSVRCTEEELAAVRERAAAAGLTESAYLRRIATTGRIVVKQARADAALTAQLQRIGVNLNQMTRAMHIKGGDVPLALQDVLADVQTLLDELMET